MASDFAREALEPFANAARLIDSEPPKIRAEDSCLIEDALWPSQQPTVGDLRRARTAYDAIGSGVKALDGPYGYLIKPVGLGEDAWSLQSDPETDTTHFVSLPLFAWDRRVTAPRAWWEERIPKDGETENEAIARLHRSPGYGGSLEDAKAAVWSAMDFAHGHALSTHTAAGAGPVGEAVAQKLFEAFGPPRANVLGDWADYPEHGKAMFRAAAPHFIASIARPVDEPGEVERLRRKVIDLEASLHDEETRVRHYSELAAETRERLEKAEVAALNINGHLFTVSSALRELQSAASAVLVGISVHNGLHADAPARREDIQGPVISQLSQAAANARAALTGNAQEAGAQQRSYPGNRTREEWEIVAQASAARAAHLPED